MSIEHELIEDMASEPFPESELITAEQGMINDTANKINRIAHKYVNVAEEMLNQIEAEMDGSLALSPMDRGILAKTLTEVNKLLESKAVAELLRDSLVANSGVDAMAPIINFIDMDINHD